MTNLTETMKKYIYELEIKFNSLFNEYVDGVKQIRPSYQVSFLIGVAIGIIIISVL